MITRMLITKNMYDELRKFEDQRILPSHKDFKRLSAIVKAEYFDSIVANLRFQAELEQEIEILKMLDKDNLIYTVRSNVELDPDPGISYVERSIKYIDISLMDVLRSISVSKLAAIALTGSEKESDLALRIGFTYAQEIARNLDKGEKPLWPSVDFNQLNIHSSYHDGLTECSRIINIQYLTWLLLHEMGHHVLKHTNNSDDENPQQMKQKEIEAELWAFNKMNTLGYSIPLVYYHMLANTVFDTILSKAKSIPEETKSTHLSWITRSQIMQDYIEHEQPVNNKWIYLNFSSMAIDTRNNSEVFTKFTLLYPLNIEEKGNLCYLIIEEDKTETLVIMVIEYKNNEAHLYSFNIKGYYIYIQNPADFSPKVEITITVDTDHKVKHNLQMDQWCFADIYDNESMGVKVRDMIDLSIVEWMSEFFSKLDINQDQRANSKKIIVEIFTAQRELLLQYSKGLLSPEKLSEDNTQLSEQMGKDLEKVIGELNFKKYRDLISQDKHFKLGMKKSGDSQMKNFGIISFRGVELLESEVKALTEIEKLAQLTFSSVPNIGDNTKMGFTSKNLRITGIGLYKCQLTEIPQSIGKLTQLQVLNLGYNSIRDLPWSFIFLTKLRKLNLENNQGIFSIPQVVMKLVSLEELILYGTMVSMMRFKESKKQIRQLKKKGIDVKA